MDALFELATEADEPAIRQLLRETPMPGRVVVSYEREPDYFLGCGTLGDTCQVLVARHAPTGEVAGILCRATRRLFVNGIEQRVGYLGQLRVATRFQGHWLLPRSAPALHRLHGDGLVAGYLSTITEENRIARGLLVERRRKVMPAFRELDLLHTLALIVPRRGRRSLQLERGSAATLGEIVAFLRSEGRRRQFFPAYCEQDFASPLLRGLSLESVLVVRAQGKIAGVVAVWDQSSFKQTVIQGYDPLLRRVRPLYNTVAWLRGAPMLPRPGRKVSHGYASMLCVAGDDPQIAAALLDQALQVAAERGYDYLMLGLAQRDPLLTGVTKRPHILYRSRIYAVTWNDGESWYEQLDDRPCAIEIASL